MFRSESQVDITQTAQITPCKHTRQEGGKNNNQEYKKKMKLCK